ncbi:MAG: GUN4 domain-containing protein [Roseofilum sp. Belize BBD 4]|uniref:serine/threonine-protein kinase n=1 Tax=Roseofilum sp. Belize BBD 4 TaxID=2821500 RepID=UPI000E8B5A43|nr:serine/threonine-protein kinase [Roseofilum sp. Belize BBD 4]MBP0034026.1 GUN4 domain-containing protein [Roseofilum sp. Belize BBD 4]HBR00197.1 serine/threonine protein kinase [Cyanobacteria bacterium UBA11691]
MSYCVNPECKSPQNPDNTKFCSSCGTSLYLRQRYRPISQLGQGGFGKTFIAIDEDIPSQPLRVVKQLYLKGFSDRVVHKAQRLFRQEAVRLDELGKHDQIPDLLANFEQDQQLYLVQEFVDGPTLTQELQQKGGYEPEEIEQLLRDILPVLQFVHDNQVIHRDIKPQNIIRRKKDNLPVLIDFGVSKWVSQTTLNQTGTIVGSAEYMPLEQLRGKVFPASDLYSLGATCLHLLTGLPPLELYDIANEKWVWRDYLLPEKRVNLTLAQTLDRMVARNLKQRFQSASEVLSVLSVSPGSFTSIAASKSQKPKSQKPKPLTSRPSSSRTAISNQPTEVTSKVFNPLHMVKTWVFGSSELPVELKSAVGVDYTKLQNLLQMKRWKAADQETWNCLHKASGKPISSFLDPRNITDIHCEDFQTVDRLWVEASEGRFGFTLQFQVYQQAGEEYFPFCQALKWPLRPSGNTEDYIQYKSNAPVAHLPSPARFKGSDWSKHVEAIASKCIICGLV